MPPSRTSSELYFDNNIALVESGQMKWSDFYIGIFNAFSSQTSYAKGDILKLVNSLISAAKDYEANKITKDDFESKQREAEATLAKIESDYQLKLDEIEASKPPPAVYQNTVKESDPLANWPMMKSPKRTTCTTYGNQTTCETN